MKMKFIYMRPKEIPPPWALFTAKTLGDGP